MELKYKGWGTVNTGGKLLIKHIEALGIASEKLHFGNKVVSVGFLLALLLNEPIEELHRAEILYLISGGIDVVNKGGYVFLMLKACL